MKKRPVAICVHGGAGDFDVKKINPEKRANYRHGLVDALTAGHELLCQGAVAVDAVVAAIQVLEENELFNAGRGASLKHDGSIGLDASIMNGTDRQAGAVTGLKRSRSPIAVARSVMYDSPYILLSGDGGDEFASCQGLEIVDNAYFYCDYRKHQLEVLQKKGTMGLDHDVDSSASMGTVGAVAMDQTNTLAAGTSTGGLCNTQFNRIGDSAIIGAGTYADNAYCAVSTTGWGEGFIRIAFAHSIVARMRYAKETLEKAASGAMAELNSISCRGGFISIDRHGNILMPFNTSAMYHGCIDSNGKLLTGIGLD